MAAEKTPELVDHQTDILAALQALGEHNGWRGESVVVEGALVYQTPLPEDPDVSGALFVVERDEPNVRLYLTLPCNIAPAKRGEATEIVVRAGCGRRFGALELDLDSGALRVRVDTDATEETIAESLVRVLDRGVALAREISPAWRALACHEARDSRKVP